MADLKGKTAFITGTNRGLGKAFVEEFARCGANVIAHARKDSDEFRGVCSELGEKFGVKVMPVFFDMTDSTAMKGTVRQLIADKTPINVLVNSAGVAHGGFFRMTPMAKIREVMNINLFAQMELTQMLLRYMMRNKPAAIVNMSSLLGLDLPAGECAYGVSKAALAAFTETLAAETGPLGVRVNAIAPGLINTEMAQLMEKSAEDRMIINSALKRKGEPIEIARLAAFLASDESSYLNGQVIKIDGGRA